MPPVFSSVLLSQPYPPATRTATTATSTTTVTTTKARVKVKRPPAAARNINSQQRLPHKSSKPAAKQSELPVLMHADSAKEHPVMPEVKDAAPLSSYSL